MLTGIVRTLQDKETLGRSVLDQDLDALRALDSRGRFRLRP